MRCHFLFRAIAKIKTVVIVFFFLLCAKPIYSVEFHNMNEIYGISVRAASSICKDETGFIWAASKIGLIRLTEDQYRIYQLPFESSNISNIQLLRAQSAFYVCGNNGQIFRYNKINDSFELLANLDKMLNIPNFMTTRMEVDSQGNFYMSSNSGLYKWDGREVKKIGTDSSWIEDIAWFDDHSIFLFRGNNLCLVDISTCQEKLLYSYKTTAPFSVSELFYDESARRLWVGTMSSGLFCFDLVSKSFSQILPGIFPKQPILDIEKITDSSILVGIDGQGIWKIEHDGRALLDVYKEDNDNLLSLRGNGVYDIFCDQETNRIWVCTYSGGVSFFDQGQSFVKQTVHQINDPNSLANNNVNSVIEDSDGNIWFATDKGISKHDLQTDTWKNFYVDNNNQSRVFLALCDDGHGKIWAGSYSSGVYLLDQKSGRELAHYSSQNPKSPFVSDFVFDMHKDKHGDIWIASKNSELVRYIPSKDQYEKYSPKNVSVVIEGNSDDEMILANTFGLEKINKNTGEIKTLKDRLSIMDVYLLGDVLWLASYGDGLVKFNMKTEEMEMFTTANGLPSNIVNSIIYSGGFFWLGMENGVCRFDPEQKTVLAYPSLTTTSFSVNYNASTNLSDGKIVFGTNKGVISFDPQKAWQVAPIGKIYIQDIDVQGNSIRHNDMFDLSTAINDLNEIRLKHNQNSFKMELLSIGALPNAKYSWKLDGVDKDWNSPSDYGMLSYTNIPSGKRKLHIRLYDKTLTQVVDERVFVIDTELPFWATWWFFVLIFLCISLFIYVVFWQYVDRLKKSQVEEKIRFFTNTAHDMRTVLTLIKAPIEELSAENMSNEGLHFLNLAKEQTRRLSLVVTKLMDFQKIDLGKEQMSLVLVDMVTLIKNRILMFQSLAQLNDIKINFVSSFESYSTAVDEAMMEKVLDNLISNAVKYSKPQSQIEISFSEADGKWMLSIKDFGIGISKSDQRHLFKEFYRSENAVNTKIVGSGIGLLLVKKYVEMHHGNITCESEEGKGCLFTVAIPYKVVQNHSTSIEMKIQDEELPEPMDLEESSKGKMMHILIVDDNSDLLDFLKLSLNREFDVSTASDGAEAWSIVQKQQLDLVVSDVMMPNMDGFELCQLIKSTAETSHIPVVLLTSLSEKPDLMQGIGLGADDYITKPFDIVILKQRIKSIIQNRNIVREKLLKMIKGVTSEDLSENKLNNEFMQRLMVVVNENISNTAFGKEEFASAMNVSSSLLYKKLKALTGQSPSDFIKTVRLEHALELLKTRKYTMIEVSEMCGFTSAGYFSTVFKKQYSISPSEFAG